MILNYYCFEINGHLSHVRPCMICGESAGLSPGPAHHMPWEAGHSTGQHRPRDHKGDQQTQEQTASADFFFFFKGKCVLSEKLFKIHLLKKQSPWLGVFLQPGYP